LKPTQRLILLLCLLLALAPAAHAQTPAPKPELVITSPAPGAVVGGVISVLGSAQWPNLQGYVVAVGPGYEPAQWIVIAEVRHMPVAQGRLAFWDTTKIPDGHYTLRLRAILADGQFQYQDVLVGPILVSNAPQSPTPGLTAIPSMTPTPTAIPSVTPTALPTLALEDGVSPYLYVTLMDQYEPLCAGWRQRYSIWLSNVGMVTVTNVVLTDTLPLGCEPSLADSTANATYDNTKQPMVWKVGEMAPGEGRKFEVLVTAASWLETGKWLSNVVVASCDQIPYVANTEQTLLSDCKFLKETAAAKPVALPTVEPSSSVEPAATGALQVGTPRPTPSFTPAIISVPEKSVKTSLDMLTALISIALVILFVLTGVLLYRQIARRK